MKTTHRSIAALLLLLTLTACQRPASTVMTPLPSVPPPTATDVLPTLTTAPPVSASRTATATSNAAEEPTVTQTPRIASATATLAAPGVTCEGAPTTRLTVDKFAYVNPEPPLPNNLRSDPGENNELIGTIEPGQAMKILEGPQCADGWLWWKVQTLATDLTGWTAEGDGQGYWLVPCASEAECKP